MPSAPPLTWLAPGQPHQPFPPARQALAHPNGLLAAGGDLHPRRLLAAYRQGIFPWFGEGEPVLWWSPHPRAVVRVGQLHRSRSLQRAWRRADFAVSSNQAFAEVLGHCARLDRGDGVWLTAEMRAAYGELHRLGHAHSVEIWRAGVLIGGIYGLRLGRVFFGESMFSNATNGSKLALIALEECLRAQGIVLLDGQVASPHLLRMGFQLWPRDTFLDALDALVDRSSSPAPWQLAAGLPAGAEHRS